MKIFIVGSVGSGKTTLAKQLAPELNINVYELDAVVYDDSLPGRPKRESDTIASIINRIDNEGQWIFEGVHREAYRQLYALADVIVLLHPSYMRRKYQIVKRYIKQQIGTEASRYPSTLKMLVDMFRWSHQFNKTEYLESTVASYEHKIVIISKQSELGAVLKKLKQKQVSSNIHAV